MVTTHFGIIIFMIYISIVVGILIKLVSVGVKGMPLFLSFFLPFLIMSFPFLPIKRSVNKEEGSETESRKRRNISLYKKIIITVKVFPALVGAIGEFIISLPERETKRSGIFPIFSELYQKGYT